jgi:hypothetical protein
MLPEQVAGNEKRLPGKEPKRYGGRTAAAESRYASCRGTGSGRLRGALAQW